MYVLSMQKIFAKQQRTQNGALRNTTEGGSLPKTIEKVLSMRIKAVKNSVPNTMLKDQSSVSSAELPFE